MYTTRKQIPAENGIRHTAERRIPLKNKIHAGHRFICILAAAAVAAAASGCGTAGTDAGSGVYRAAAQAAETAETAETGKTGAAPGETSGEIKAPAVTPAIDLGEDTDTGFLFCSGFTALPDGFTQSQSVSAENATVCFEATDSSGNGKRACGVIADVRDGKCIIVTAKHALTETGGGQIKVIFPGGMTVTEKTGRIYRMKGHDTAVFSVSLPDGSGAGAASVSTEKCRKLSDGGTLSVCSVTGTGSTENAEISPLGCGHGENDILNAQYTQGEIRQGKSGSGIWDRSGCLCGMLISMGANSVEAENVHVLMKAAAAFEKDM